MYNPEHFQENNPEVIKELIEANALGTFIYNGAEGLDAAHLPFEYITPADQPAKLLAHVARNNTVWKELKNGDEVLVIFRAHDSYISPNWFPSKHEAHRQVPTWNYQVVHLHGKVTIRDDVKFLRGLVARLTRVNEEKAKEEKPWKMTDSEADYIDTMLAAIVGMEIEVTKIECKSKLSQNKENRDRQSAAHELRLRGSDATADAMENTVKPDAGGN